MVSNLFCLSYKFISSAMIKFQIYRISPTVYELYIYMILKRLFAKFSSGDMKHQSHNITFNYLVIQFLSSLSYWKYTIVSKILFCLRIRFVRWIANLKCRIKFILSNLNFVISFNELHLINFLLWNYLSSFKNFQFIKSILGVELDFIM